MYENYQYQNMIMFHMPKISFRTMSTTHISDDKRQVFSLDPLGRFGHRVAMSVNGSLCGSVVLRYRVQFFFRPFIGPQVT